MARAGFENIGRAVHRVAIVGRVIDAVTGLPIGGVEVSISDGPRAFTERQQALRRTTQAPRRDRTRTDGEGSFRWLDLAPGSYTLHAAVAAMDTRYAESADASVLVTSESPGALEIALPPTALTGLVSSDKLGRPLAMVRVRLRDSGETAFSGADGRFTLSPIEAGADRPVELSAARHLGVTLAVTTVRGRTTTMAPVTLMQS